MRPDAILPLAVAVPLTAGALVVAIGRGRGRRVAGPLATVAVLGLAVAIGWWTRSDGGVLVHWLGGWRPLDGVVVGIPFVSGPVSGPLLVLVAVLVGSALWYSQLYLEDPSPGFWALMLLFLTGMMGLVATGDVFNLFVFYELVGVSAYALTGYVIQHEGPLQGAINFAVSNTVGALLVLSGGTFLYVATGTPNMAAAGAAVDAGATGPAVIAAYVLLTVGFFVKAAIVPFHFWHADAHAVAPTPVCAVFAGIMIQLGLFAFARLNWVVFSGLWQAHDDAVRAVLVSVGAITAIGAGVMALLQSHLKRMLAFSSLAHSGVVLLGLGTLSVTGVAGATVYVLSHAGVKAALFLTVGVLVYRFGAVDEADLHGKGRGMWGTASLFVLGGLTLAGLPPFGISVGKTLIEKAGAHHGLGVLSIGVLLATGALTGAAVLRAAGRVFFGWGEIAKSDATDEGEDEEEQRETDGDGRVAGGRAPRLLWAPAALLLGMGLVVGALPSVATYAHHAADWFVHPDHYLAAVLGTSASELAHEPSSWLTLKGVIAGLGAVALAGVFAGFALFAGGRAPFRRGRLFEPVVGALRRLHSGHVGDYVTWLVVGLAVLGGVFGSVLR